MSGYLKTVGVHAWHAGLRTKCILKNVHPQNSNHLRSHSRAITTLDHTRLGLGNKFSGKQIGPNFFAFDKFTLQNLANKSGGA